MVNFSSRCILHETAMIHHIYCVLQVLQFIETSVSKVISIVYCSISYIYEIVCFQGTKMVYFSSRCLLHETAMIHHNYFVFQVLQVIETSVSRVISTVYCSIAYIYEIVCFQCQKMVCFLQQMPTARDSNDAPHLFCIPSVVGDRDIGIKSYQHCVLLDCVSL